MLSSFPYKTASPCERDQSVVDCDEEGDAQLCVGSFSQRLQILLKRCHQSEFPHVFACATPCSENGIGDDTVKEQRPGYTELAPLHSIIPWLEVLHAHNVKVSYNANAFMAAEIGSSESQLVEMASPSACHESGIETHEKDCSMDHTYSYVKHQEDSHGNESSSDETIVDVPSDSEMVDNAAEANESFCDVRNLSVAKLEKQNCHTETVPCDPLVNGTDGESPHSSSADMDCAGGCVSVNCMSSSVATDPWFDRQLSEDAQFEVHLSYVSASVVGYMFVIAYMIGTVFFRQSVSVCAPSVCPALCLSVSGFVCLSVCPSVGHVYRTERYYSTL